MKVEQSYNVFNVSKRNGSFRRIFAPSAQYKKWLRRHSFKLACLAEENETKMLEDMSLTSKYPLGVNHGFMMGRNPVTNAKCHVKAKFILSMDLKDFFDCVNRSAVNLSSHFDDQTIDLFFIDGVARQGLPTSPSIANLAFLSIDKEIIKMLELISGGNECVTYSRYADDLTFGFQNEVTANLIIDCIEKIIDPTDFSINQKKTHLQKSNSGNFVVTGVGINPSENEVVSTRKIRRKIRAAKHQDNQNSINGLVEFSKCKMPNFFKQTSIIEKAHKLSLQHELGACKQDLINSLPSQSIEHYEGITIDSYASTMFDLVRFSGLFLSSGIYKNKKAVPFWAMLSGCKLCYLNDESAICLLFELENNEYVFDYLSGKTPEMASKLKSILKKRGYVDAHDANKLFRGSLVVGEVKGNYKPYAPNFKLVEGVKKLKIKPFHRLMV